MDPERIAALWAELMRGLGYRALRRAGRRLGRDGDDLPRRAPRRRTSLGIHLNMVVAFPPDPANPADGLTQDELIRADAGCSSS